MRTTKDYHIHSKFSWNNHAKNSIRELVEEAIAKGMEEIAITNHGLGHILYGFRKKHISIMKAEIAKLQAEYPQIKIMLGVEANILSLKGDTDIDEDIVNNCDIVLCGYHTFVSYKSFWDFWTLVVLNQFAKGLGWFKEKQIKRNTAAIVNALDKYSIDILTHPGEKMLVDMDSIAQAAQKNGTLLEINDSHKHLNTEELAICKKYNVWYSIDSDSHRRTSIGSYENALKRAVDAGINLNKIINLKQD